MKKRIAALLLTVMVILTSVLSTGTVARAESNTNLKMKEWLDSHNVNNYLLYPLAAVELGAIKEAPENNENLLSSF